MTHQMWRLSEAGPENFGLACTDDGLLLGRTPLIERRDKRFVVRERDDIERLLQRGYRYTGEADRIMPGLAAVARALNADDPCLARIIAVHLKIPNLPSGASREAMETEDRLIKYGDETWDPEKHPRTGTPPNPGWFAPTEHGADGAPRVHLAENDDPRRSSDVSHVAADGPHDPALLAQAFEREYDDLGPVDFAKRVIEFGDWLGRAGGNLSPDQRERALAEYSFLQDRLSLWLSYDYKPPIAGMNLISAALTLYQGAVNGGFARAGNLPRSMLDVGGVAWAFDNVTPRGRSSTQPDTEAPPAPVGPPKEMVGIGGTVDNSKTKIDWTKGIKEQNGQWEDYYAEQNLDAKRLPPNSKVFDFVEVATGEAISNKTLNTVCMSYIRNPQQIYKKLTEYVDAAVD